MSSVFPNSPIGSSAPISFTQPQWEALASTITGVFYDLEGEPPVTPLPPGHVKLVPTLELFAPDGVEAKFPQVVAHLAAHLGTKVILKVNSLHGVFAATGDFVATGYSVGYYYSPLVADTAMKLKQAVAQLSSSPHHMGTSPPQILVSALPDMPAKHLRGLVERSVMSLKVPEFNIEATLAFKTSDGLLLNSQALFRAYSSGYSKTQLLMPMSAQQPTPAASGGAQPPAPKKKPSWASPFAAVGGGGAPVRNLDASLLMAADSAPPTTPKRAAAAPLPPHAPMKAAGGGGGGGGPGPVPFNMTATLALMAGDTAPHTTPKRAAAAKKYPAAPKKAAGGGGGGGGPAPFNMAASLALVAVDIPPSASQFDFREAQQLLGITSSALAAAGGGGGAAASVCSSISHHSQHELQEEQGLQVIPEGHVMCITDGCTSSFEKQPDIKRCIQCRQHQTRYIRHCKETGCDALAFTSQKHVTALQSKWGEDFEPFSRCFAHSKARHDSAAASQAEEGEEEDFAHETVCSSENCEGTVQLSQGEIDYFESKSLQLPTRCKACRAERKETKKSTVECDCEVCGETFKIPDELKKSLEEQDKQITCTPCRTTNTRNCNYCRKSFLTLAQIAWSKAKYAEWHPPNHCSKKCKAAATAEVDHKEGATRGGKRAFK